MNEISAPPVSVDGSLGLGLERRASALAKAVFYGHLGGSGFALVLVVVCYSLSTFLYELQD